jgi:hypothetical protein
MQGEIALNQCDNAAMRLNASRRHKAFGNWHCAARQRKGALPTLPHFRIAELTHFKRET